jgi:hypothetical protein
VSFFLDSPVERAGDITGISSGQIDLRRGQFGELGMVWKEVSPYPQAPTVRHAEIDLQK